MLNKFTDLARDNAAFAYPFATGAATWLGQQAFGFLGAIQSMLSLVTGPELAEFLTRSYVFPPLCMVAVAVLQGAVKLVIHFSASAHREAQRSIRWQSTALAEFERMTGRTVAEVMKAR